MCIFSTLLYTALAAIKLGWRLLLAGWLTDWGIISLHVCHGFCLSVLSCLYAMQSNATLEVLSYHSVFAPEVWYPIIQGLRIN